VYVIGQFLRENDDIFPRAVAAVWFLWKSAIMETNLVNCMLATIVSVK